MSEPEDPSIWTQILGSLKQQIQSIKKVTLKMAQGLQNKDERSALWSRIKARVASIPWESLFDQVKTWVVELWNRIRTFSWRKEEFQKIATRAKTFASEQLSEENQAKVKAKAKGLQDRARKLGSEMQPLGKQAGEKLRAGQAAVKEKLADISDKTGKNSSQETPHSYPDSEGVFARILSRLTSLRWVQYLVDRWMSLPIWRSEKLFTRYVVPILAFSGILFFSAGLLLYGYVRSTISKAREDIRKEASQSLLAGTYEKYLGDVMEKSEILETIVSNNVTKTAIVADAPTFQDLNIQKMEEFSRSLIRKDSNLLNVVVLTNEETKRNIRTRRIGDTTRFLFTCCELPENRTVGFREIDEKSWLAEINKRKSAVSDLYLNPANGEKYFYHAKNIEDVSGNQRGAVLLRYNLNSAVRTLQRTPQTGSYYLIANDSLVVATSADTTFPNVEVLAAPGSRGGAPLDYVVAVIDLIRTSSSAEQAINRMTSKAFISDPRLFQYQFRNIIKDPLTAQAEPDSLGQRPWLTEAQAQSILALSFGQLLGLKQSVVATEGTSTTLSVEDGQVLALAYLDSIKQVGTGIIRDEGYLLTFATNKYGWTLINQSSNDEYLAAVVAKDSFILDRFSTASSGIFWFIFLSGIFFLLVFLVLVSGLMNRFIQPIRALTSQLRSRSASAGKKEKIQLEPQDELGYLGDSFDALSEELEEYIHRLEVSNRDLDQYAQLIAHDLKQPLRTIRSFFQLLLKKNSTAFDESSQQYVDFIISSTDRMDLMIKQMLEYASLSGALEEGEVKIIKLDEQVESARHNLHEMIKETGAVIQVSELPSLSGRERMIHTVFQNLIENALKYHRAGVPPVVNISAEQRSEGWVISVKDNGIGIEKQDQPSVFQMFARLQQSEGPSGTGIGLASCHKIIEHFGGKIWVESAGKDQGSTFFFLLPA